MREGVLRCKLNHALSGSRLFMAHAPLKVTPATSSTESLNKSLARIIISAIGLGMLVVEGLLVQSDGDA